MHCGCTVLFKVVLRTRVVLKLHTRVIHETSISTTRGTRSPKFPNFGQASSNGNRLACTSTLVGCNGWYVLLMQYNSLHHLTVVIGLVLVALQP